MDFKSQEFDQLCAETKALRDQLRLLDYEIVAKQLTPVQVVDLIEQKGLSEVLTKWSTLKLKVEEIAAANNIPFNFSTRPDEVFLEAVKYLKH